MYELTQPLVTDEGFLNPACMNELEAAIRNIPPAYERLKNDVEWTTKRWTFKKEITGYFAHWAVRQLETTPFAPKLETVIGFLHHCLKDCFDSNDMALLSLCDINYLLHKILMPEKIFLDWNDAFILKDWLDLDALLHNVCISIRNERRINDEFDKRFEAENITYDLGSGI